MGHMELNRRDFLKAAAAGGAAAAAAAGASVAVAEEQAAPEAGVDAGTPKGYLCPEDWLGEAPVVADADIAETVEVEVLVLGSGHAGTQAGLAAAQAGASVAVVEAQDKDMYVAFGEDLGTFNSQFLTERGWGGYNLGEVVSEFTRRSQGNILVGLIKKYVEGSGEMLDNLVSVMPEESTFFDLDNQQCAVQCCYGKTTSADYPVTVGGLKSWAGSIRTLGTAPDYPVDGREGVSRMTELEIDCRLAAEALGATWYFGHKAVVLTQDETGAVTGAVAKASDGTYKKFVASKGTIIACGDFSGNADMVYNLIDGVNESNIRLGKTREDMGSMGRDGSGIKMGCWAGGMIEPHPRGSMNNNSAIPGPFGTAPFLTLNAEGKRWFNEALSEYGSATLVRQPAGMTASITDANYAKTVTGSSCDHGAADFGTPMFWEKAQEDMAAAVGSGADGYQVTKLDILSIGNPGTKTVYCADTLEELLGYLGFEGEALENALASVERYNELCDKGADEDFGKDAELMVPVREAPFYGFVGNNGGARGTGLVTVCGLVTDEDFNVLTADRSAKIPGLYAVGNSLGQRYGAIYTMPIAGNSIGMAMTHGRLAGKLVAGL